MVSRAFSASFLTERISAFVTFVANTIINFFEAFNTMNNICFCIRTNHNRPFSEDDLLLLDVSDCHHVVSSQGAVLDGEGVTVVIWPVNGLVFVTD